MNNFRLTSANNLEMRRLMSIKLNFERRYIAGIRKREKQDGAKILRTNVMLLSDYF